MINEEDFANKVIQDTELYKIWNYWKHYIKLPYKEYEQQCLKMGYKIYTIENEAPFIYETNIE